MNQINPARETFSQIMRECYNQDISFSNLVKKAGFSSGTAHNDRQNPLNIPLKRLLVYMQVLDIKHIDIDM